VKESRKNKVGGVKFKGLLDSGTGRSFIKTEIFNKIKNGIIKFTEESPVDLTNNNSFFLS